MDPMVSARVPLELRDQVNDELRKIGSSPTELINSAYEFFLKTKSLPNSSPSLEPGKRTLSKRDIQKIQASLDASTLFVPESFFDGKSYDELLAEALRKDYESLA